MKLEVLDGRLAIVGDWIYPEWTIGNPDTDTPMLTVRFQIDSWYVMSPPGHTPYVCVRADNLPDVLRDALMEIIMDANGLYFYDLEALEAYWRNWIRGQEEN